jgi:hypothetical protein
VWKASFLEFDDIDISSYMSEKWWYKNFIPYSIFLDATFRERLDE